MIVAEGGPLEAEDSAGAIHLPPIDGPRDPLGAYVSFDDDQEKERCDSINLILTFDQRISLAHSKSRFPMSNR